MHANGAHCTTNDVINPTLYISIGPLNCFSQKCEQPAYFSIVQFFILQFKMNAKIVLILLIYIFIVVQFTLGYYNWTVRDLVLALMSHFFGHII